MLTLRVPYVYAALGLLFAPFANCQQLSDAPSYIDYPGLSNACLTALNTTVTCPPFLSPVSASGEILDFDLVTELCVNACLTSLKDARDTIQDACTADTDVIVHNNIAYPATFIVDNYLNTYNVSCRKDSSTGAFCDPQILAWSSQSFLNSSQACSDCWLGGQAVRLSNPLGYDANLASQFASLTSSCNATGMYSTTSPTSYAINATATTTSAPTATTPATSCTGSYTVQEGDECNSVALELGVSTYDLLYTNDLDIYCQNFASAVNSTLCVPPGCDTHVWQGSDSCESVVNTLHGVTVPEFLSWNPNFNSLCQNSVNFLNYVVCVSPPGGYLNSSTTDTANSTGYTGGATTALPVPTNAMNGSNTDCGYWYTVVEGDQCALISVQFSLSLEDFYFLNPKIDANCTNLWLGEAYCVAPVGTITSYSGYPVTTPRISITSATFPSVTITMSTPTTGYVATSSAMPTVSGTLSNCTDYRNYDSVNNFNDCRYVAFAESIELSDFLDWNPSLPSTDCVLEPGYSYCVGDGSDPYAGTGAESTYCLGLNATELGTISTCNCFTRVRGYQNSTTGYGCSTLQSDYHVTLDELLEWNSWMGSDCDAALFRNMSYYATRAVCIGVDTSGSPTTSLTITVTATTTTSSSVGPTQTDTVPGCKEFYTVVDGDGCDTIEDQFGITFSQFYAWNPSVGSECSNLWLGYAYCVDGPTSTATITASTTGPDAPTQTGIAADCTKYHTVKAGDSCANIQFTYDVTFAQLYKWNPAIGEGCETLVIGYAVCVGVSS
ncbi:uncharacterized protein BDV14DRAFT_194147 [Aspergillus stella-maris]|uniref:uncharacterized protein n=1 Tax=Aspergillus stella-maris TaxID=1810926 RepID=UPI003CCE388F